MSRVNLGHQFKMNGSNSLLTREAQELVLMASDICRTTIYLALCFSSLSTYTSTIQTSPMQLAHTALSVSINGARSTSAVMKRMSASGAMSPREATTMSDCMENVGDMVDELCGSLRTMKHLGGKDMGCQLNSIQTWLSAALDDDTLQEWVRAPLYECQC